MKTTTYSKTYFCILFAATIWIGVCQAQTDLDTINSPAISEDAKPKEDAIPSINATSQTTLPSEETASTTLPSPAGDTDDKSDKTSDKNEDKPDVEEDKVSENKPEDTEGILLPPLGSTMSPEGNSANTTSISLEVMDSYANKSFTDTEFPALNSTSDNAPKDASNPILMVNSTSDSASKGESDPIPMVNSTDTDNNNVSSTTTLTSVGINVTVTGAPAVNATEASGNGSLTLSPSLSPPIGTENSTTPTNATTTLSTVFAPNNVTNTTTLATTTSTTTTTMMTTTTQSTTTSVTSATTTTESTTTTAVAPSTDPITPFPPIKSETCLVLECFWAVETGSDYISFIAHKNLMQPDKVLVSLSHSPSDDSTSENVTNITESKDKYSLEGLDPDSEWISCISLSKDDGSPILQKECHKVRTQTAPKAAGFKSLYIIIIVASFLAIVCLVAMVVACRLKQLKKQKTKKRQRSSWADTESGVEMRERYEMRPLRPQTNVVSLYENQRQPLANLTSFNPSAKPIPEDDAMDGNGKVVPNSNGNGISVVKKDVTRNPSEDFTDEEWDENFDDDTGGQGDVVPVKLGDSFRQPKPLEIIPKATSEAGGSSVNGGDSQGEGGGDAGEAKETDALVKEEKVPNNNVGSEHSMSSFKS